MTDNDLYILEGAKLIQATIDKVPLTFVGGDASMYLRVTPQSVKKMRKMDIIQPRAEIHFNLEKGLRVLVGHHVGRQAIHIFEGGLKFPPISTQDHHGYQLIEFAGVRAAWGKRTLVQNPGESHNDYQYRRIRIEQAFGYDRYWFAIPSQLSVNSIYIEERENGKKGKLWLSDRDYARKVADYNHLEGGVWKSKRSRKMLVIANLLSILLVIAAFTFMFSITEALKPDDIYVPINFGIFILMPVGVWALRHFLPKSGIEPL